MDHQLMNEYELPACPPFDHLPARLPIHINLWLFQGKAPKDRQEVEVIIHQFKFTPE